MTFTWFDKLTDILLLVPEEEDRKTLAYAFVMYGSEGEEPDLAYPLNALFESVRGDLDNTRSAHRNGRKGGRPKKEQVSEVEEQEESQPAEAFAETETEVEPVSERVSETTETPSETPFSSSETIRKDKKGKDKKEEESVSLGETQRTHGEEQIPYAEIVEALNERTGRSYRASTPKTRTLIHARWAEGFRFEDFQRVIEGQAAKWMGDPEMERYLRPETLFGTKFEGYLQAAPAKTRPKPKAAAPSKTPAEELAEWDAEHAEWLEGGGRERARSAGGGTSTLTPAQFRDISLAAERDRLALRAG